MDEHARQNILEEFKRDRERIEKSLEREKERQLAALNERLEKRRLRLLRLKKLNEPDKDIDEDNDSTSADKIWDGDANVENLKGIKATVTSTGHSQDQVSEKEDGETDEEYLQRIEAEFKQNDLKQAQQIEAEKAKLHNKLSKRRAEAKRKKMELEK